MTRVRERGFTLVELMITIAIVGILASMALSWLETYVIRAKVTEGVVAAAAAKTPVAEYFAINGELPPGLGDETFEGFEQYVDSQYIEKIDWHVEQRIEIEFDEAALGVDGEVEIGLEPIVTGGVMRWRCGQDQMDEENLKYVPLNCRNQYW